MRFSKKMTQLLCMLMAVAMCLSVSATAFATEVVNAEENMAVVTVDENGATVVTYASNQVTVDHATSALRGSQNVTICPPNGATLKMAMNNSPADTTAIKVETTKNGGWWPSNTTNVPKGQAGKTYTLISNCNGEPYTVKFTADNGYFVAILYW